MSHLIRRLRAEGHPLMKEAADELESATLDYLDLDNLRMGREIQRAAAELPDGVEVVISIEKHTGIVKWFDADGNEYDIDNGGDGFSHQLTAAIDAATKGA